MGTPDMNPLSAKMLGGADFRKQIKRQLEEAAAKTDDPAYRARLLEVAEGKRPLRTLMADPGFLDQMGLRGREAERRFDETMQQRIRESLQDPNSIWHGTPDEVRERVRSRLIDMGVTIPDTEELKALYCDAERLGTQAGSIIRQERLTGWGGTEERLAERDAQQAGKSDTD